MMDRCTFMNFLTETAVHCHFKAWKRLLNIEEILKNLRESKSWANFNFLVNCPFNCDLFRIFPLWIVRNWL